MPISDAAGTFKEAAFNNACEFTQGTGYQLPEYAFVPPPELTTGTAHRHAIIIIGGGGIKEEESAPRPKRGTAAALSATSACSHPGSGA